MQKPTRPNSCVILKEIGERKRREREGKEIGGWGGEKEEIEVRKEREREGTKKEERDRERRGGE